MLLTGTGVSRNHLRVSLFILAPVRAKNCPYYPTNCIEYAHYRIQKVERDPGPELTVQDPVTVERENDDLHLSVTLNSEWPEREGGREGLEQGL